LGYLSFHVTANGAAPLSEEDFLTQSFSPHLEFFLFAKGADLSPPLLFPSRSLVITAGRPPFVADFFPRFSSSLPAEVVEKAPHNPGPLFTLPRTLVYFLFVAPRDFFLGALSSSLFSLFPRSFLLAGPRRGSYCFFLLGCPCFFPLFSIESVLLVRQGSRRRGYLSLGLSPLFVYLVRAVDFGLPFPSSRPSLLFPFKVQKL